MTRCQLLGLLLLPLGVTWTQAVVAGGTMAETMPSLTPELQARIAQADLTAGERYFFDLISRTGGDTYWLAVDVVVTCGASDTYVYAELAAGVVVLGQR